MASVLSIFKVKIYSGTDNFQTTLRQFQRYIEYQIGTKSKSYALHTFCILSAYFIKNIYITCQRTIAKATEEAVLVSSSLSRTLRGFHPSSVSIRRITARLSDLIR